LRMVAFGGEGQRGLAVVGGGVGVGTVHQEKFKDFDVAVCGCAEEGRIGRAVVVVGIEALFEEPLDGFGAASGHRGGEGIVAGTVGGRSVDIGTFSGEVTGDFKLAEEAGEGEDGKAVRRKGTGFGGVGFDEMFYAREIAGTGGFVEIHGGAGGEQEIADFGAVGVDGEEEGGGFRFVANGEERGIGVEEGADLREVVDANGFEEGFAV